MDKSKVKLEDLKFYFTDEKIIWAAGGPKLQFKLNATTNDNILFENLAVEYPRRDFNNYIDKWSYSQYELETPDISEQEFSYILLKIDEFLDKKLKEVIKNERKQSIPKILKHQIYLDHYKDRKSVFIRFRLENDDNLYRFVLEENSSSWRCVFLSDEKTAYDKLIHPSLLWCDYIFDQLIDIVNSTDKFRVKNAVQPYKRMYLIPFYEKEKSYG